MQKKNVFQANQSKGLKKKIQNYFFMTFLNWLISIVYYRKVISLNEQLNPQFGPRIVYANHHNLFLDAWVGGVQTKGYKNLLVSAKTFKQKIMGTYSKLSGCISIQTSKQQQDGIIINIIDNVVYGKSTAFKTFKLGQLISFDDGEPFKINKIISNTVLQLSNESEIKINKEKIQTFYLHSNKGYLNSFKVAFDKLNMDQIVIIFPQSQLNMSQKLFAFKHGMAKMALQFNDQYKDKQVKLCPWVFHHYNSHHWRSLLILDFCEPFSIPQNIKMSYKQNKRQAICQLSKLCRQKLNQKFIEIPNPFSMLTVTFIRKILLFGRARSINFSQKIEINRKIARFLIAQSQKGSKKLENLAHDLNNLQKLCSSCGDSLRNKPNRNILFSFSLLIIITVIIIILAILMTPAVTVMLIPTYFVRKFPQQLRRTWEKRSNYEYKRNDLIASFRVVYGFTIYMLSFISIFFIMLLLRIFQQTSVFNSFVEAIFIPFVLLLGCIVVIKGYDLIGWAIKAWRYNYCLLFNRRKMQVIQELRGSIDEKIKEIMGSSIDDIKNIVQLQK